MAPGSLCLQARALSALSAKAVVGKPFANQPVGRHPVLLVTRRCVVSVPICCEIQGLHTLPPARGPWGQLPVGAPPLGPSWAGGGHRGLLGSDKNPG